jgi:hypothetical protein
MLVIVMNIRGDHFWSGSVFIKKSNQTDIFFLKKKTETEPKPGQTNRFRFGSVWFFRFFAYKTETEPNRPVFSKM